MYVYEYIMYLSFLLCIYLHHVYMFLVASCCRYSSVLFLFVCVSLSPSLLSLSLSFSLSLPLSLPLSLSPSLSLSLSHSLSMFLVASCCRYSSMFSFFVCVCVCLSLPSFSLSHFLPPSPSLCLSIYHAYSIYRSNLQNCRSLLQKSPTKETILCDLISIYALCGRQLPIWGGYDE